MTELEPLGDDTPFEIIEKNANRVVVQFAEYVDHRRTAALDDRLFEAMRRHERTACDVSASKEIDSDWLALIADLTVETRDLGKRVLVVGLSGVLQRSADVLGLEGTLVLVDTLDKTWA